MYQPALDDGTQVHFEAVVLNISCDAGPRLKFKEFARKDRSGNRSIDNQMGNVDFPLDTGMLADHQRSSPITSRTDIAFDLAIHPKTAHKGHVTFYFRTRSDQAIDPVLRFIGFVFLEKHGISPLKRNCLRGPNDTVLYQARFYTCYTRFQWYLKRPFDTLKVLEYYIESLPCRIVLLRQNHHSTFTFLLQTDHQLNTTSKLAILFPSLCRSKQAIAVMPRISIRLDAQPIDGKAGLSPFRGSQVFKECQILLETAILLLQGLDLANQLLLCRALYLNIAFTGIGQGTQFGCFLLQRLNATA